MTNFKVPEKENVSVHNQKLFDALQSSLRVVPKLSAVMAYHNQKIAIILAVAIIFLTACSDDDNDEQQSVMNILSVTNVLDSKVLVESGTFQNTGDHPVFLPGESFSFQFSAAKGQALSFATMYGWSNDLFFAPENPGIQLYDFEGNPVEGDVSSQIKSWDNGTRINQAPGEDLMHPGDAETTPMSVSEVKGMDDQGNTYVSASELMKVDIQYEGNSIFTLTIENTSGGTDNPTPFSPGVWAISYVVGGDLLDSTPLYSSDELSENGLTNIAEAGDNSVLGDYLLENTGVFTPLSPILVVIYNGIDNPIFMKGEPDAGNGLAKLAQTGDASDLASYLETVTGVKQVYVLSAESSTVLLPMIGSQNGSMVSQQIDVKPDNKIAIATMYGFSNDWFFATKDEVYATQMRDISSHIGLFDSGTAMDQFPGAGINQAALGGMPQTENMPVVEIANPNAFNTLPAINEIIQVAIQ